MDPELEGPFSLEPGSEGEGAVVVALRAKIEIQSQWPFGDY